MDDAVYTPAALSKNREPLLAGDIARQFFAGADPRARAVAEQKSFTRKDGTGAALPVCEATAGADKLYDTYA